MIIDNLASKIDVTLSLTVANNIVVSLSPGIEKNVLLKSTAVIAIILTLTFDSNAKKNATLVKEEDQRETSVGIVHITRRLSILAFIQLAMSVISPETHTLSSADTNPLYRGAPFLHVPHSIIPVVESFTIASLAIIMVTLVARMISSLGTGRRPIVENNDNRDKLAELDRMLLSIQYMFADIVSGLFHDSSIKRILAFIGMVSLSKLVEYTRGNSNQSGADQSDTKYNASQIWFSAIFMAWVNISMQLIIPQLQWSSTVSVVLEIITGVSVVLLGGALKTIVPGVQSLHGYLEWNLSNIIAGAAIAQGTTFFEIILASGISIWFFSFFGAIINYLFGKSLTGSDVLVSISTIILVNNSVQLVISYIKSSTSIDQITVIFITIIMGRAIMEIISLAHKR